MDHIGEQVGKDAQGRPVFAEIERDSFGSYRTIYAIRQLMLFTRISGGTKVSLSCLDDILNKDPKDLDLDWVVRPFNGSTLGAPDGPL